ncbi:hypothetical protein ES332_D13G108600v1 [Gossypium tomentosum]|uniref:Uncharacterized protein n=1 Tax=Gossypium tomentosum TaxID=34277 RepID=A0A5D2HWL5_GOSTO|nr:hypothetical protein ES332_D13G108600v1 [Gossypium tomentosum]
MFKKKNGCFFFFCYGFDPSLSRRSHAPNPHSNFDCEEATRIRQRDISTSSEGTHARGGIAHAGA